MQICTKIVIKILEKWRFSINTRQNMRLVPQVSCTITLMFVMNSGCRNALGFSINSISYR